MLIFAALAVVAGAPLQPEADGKTAAIIVPDQRVRASDISSGSPAGDAVIAKLPPGVGRIELTEAQRLSLLRNRFPGGDFSLLHRGPLTVVRGETPGSGTTGNCFATQTDIRSGEAIAREDLSEVGCGHDRPGHG